MMLNNKRKTAVLVLGTVLVLAGAATAYRSGWLGSGLGKNDPATSEESGYFEYPGVIVKADPWKVLERIIDRYYLTDQHTTYSGKMNLYDDNELKPRLLEQHEFKISFLNNEFYYSLGSLEMVCKKDLQIIANHSDRSIYVRKDVVSEDAGALTGLITLKKLLGEREASVRLSKTGAMGVITINNFPDPRVQAYQLWYDTGSYTIRRINMGMIRLTSIDEPEMVYPNELTEVSTDGEAYDGFAYKLEVLFEKVQSNQNGNFYPERKMLTGNKGNYTLTPAYKDFTLIQ